MFTQSNRSWAPVGVGLVVVAPALLLAACGGSSGSGYGSQGSSSTTDTAATSSTAKVATHSGPLGTFLTDGSGRAVYLFAADHGSSSTCTGPCATAWPPFTSKGSATATGQVKAGMLGTTSRGGGVQQVTYGGHPLYYFAGDQGAGQTNGEGSTGFGASWWVVSPGGTAITHASGGSTSSSGSGGTGPGGY